MHVGGWREFGHQSNHGRCHERPGGKTARERWERSPWRKNEDDAKMDGERLKEEGVMMEKDYKEMLEMQEHVPAPTECA